MNILFCCLDVSFYRDSSGNVYINNKSSYFDRLSVIDGDITIAGRSVDFSNQVNLVNIKMIANVVGFINVPKHNKPFDFFAIANSIKKVLKKTISSFDRVFIRYQGLYSYIVCHYARKNKVPHLIELGGDPWDAFWNHGVFGKIVAIPLTLRCKKDIKYSQYVHYVTEEYLQKKYPTNGKSIAASNVVLKEFDIDILNRRIDKIQNMHGKMVLGTAAAVDVRYKGQEYVIKALSALRAKGFECFEYQIIGKGNSNYLKYIAKKYHVEDKVVFLGRLNRDEVFDWLDGIDLYIQPSLQEGLPRALLEAMSRALPCIGAHTAGIPELIDQSFVYKKRQMPKRIADCILKIIKPENMQPQSIRNYEVSKKYELETIEKSRNLFYKEFLKSN